MKCRKGHNKKSPVRERKEWLKKLIKKLFKQGFAVVVEVAVHLQNRLSVGDSEDDNTVPLAAYIQRRKTAVIQKLLGFFQGRFHGNTQTQQFVPGRPAGTGNNLISVDFIQIASLYHLSPRHGF